MLNKTNNTKNSISNKYSKIIKGLENIFEKIKKELVKKKELSKDKTYLNSRKIYDGVPESKKVYNRYHVSFLTAIDGLPKLIKPKRGSNLFELRIYEGYSEDAVRRKIEMFNKDELKIFDDTGLYSVFFGEQISGPLMPSLTYMLAFESMEERNTNWKKFSADPLLSIFSLATQFNATPPAKHKFLHPVVFIDFEAR